jgi:hypothetical protein
MTSALEALAGRLVVQAGTPQALSGGRPVVTPALMRRLTQGLPAAQLPARLGQVFSLCGTAHRMTSRRAVRAALGEVDDAAHRETESRLLHLWTAREHLQRLAFDLPRRLPVAGLVADGSWLRDMPLRRLPDDAEATDTAALRALHAPLLSWLESHVLGGASAAWQAAWRQEPGAEDGQAAASPLSVWARSHTTPVQRWLDGVQGPGHSLALPSRPLDLAQTGPGAWQALAAQLAQDGDFTRRPTWLAAPAETGCWTRCHRTGAAPQPKNAWMRWQSRLDELVQLASSAPVLHAGAWPLGAGEGIAWTEMSRGLLVHWVRLGAEGGQATVQDCRVLAPTEWNFHPEGSLGRALAAPGLAAEAVQAAVSALDACVEVDWPTTDSEAGHA